jgi:hypothetical protein
VLRRESVQGGGQSSDDALRAQVEELRAQLEELKRQQALALAQRDTRSVVVSMLDPRITPEIVKAHFAGYGSITLLL